MVDPKNPILREFNVPEPVTSGKPFVVLVVITIAYMFLQNLTGIAVASAMGLDRIVGLLGGSVSLLGRHGTTIAWTPTFVNVHGISNASEKRSFSWRDCEPLFSSQNRACAYRRWA